MAAAVATGLEVFLEERAPAYRGLRLGLIAHAASVTRSLTSAVRAIAECPGLSLCCLFGPEHGLTGAAQDMVAVEGGGSAPAPEIPVFSLYGSTLESLSPRPEMLEGIDLLIADLQDVGSRYYTFAVTVALALEAIARRGGTLVVLDRPNPLGGLAVEGPGLAPEMRSFVGHFLVPVRHGMTIGELLRSHARAEGLEASLEVVPMRGWDRSMDFEVTGLPWVPPSPNMPTVDTAYVYPGACLVEGTNLSEGRGTTRPFEWIGAPFLDPDKLAATLTDEGLPGVIFRPLTFTPGFHKWARELCGGVALHVTDRRAFQPVRTGVAVLAASKRLAPSSFAWRREPYEFVSDQPAIDLLTAGWSVREAIDSQRGLAEITRVCPTVGAAWRAGRSPLLLY